MLNISYLREYSISASSDYQILRKMCEEIEAIAIPEPHEAFLSHFFYSSKFRLSHYGDNQYIRFHVFRLQVYQILWNLGILKYNAPGKWAVCTGKGH